MARALRVCSTSGCPELTSGGRCDTCNAEAAQLRAGHREHGGGNRAHWRAARAACLRGHSVCPNPPCLHGPICACADQTHGHPSRCYTQANVADHWPETKRDLLALGVSDPDALPHLRSLCTSCHNKHTAATTPGGWNRR